eukprot:507742-Pelagomonas_calceolata.AAC.10
MHTFGQHFPPLIITSPHHLPYVHAHLWCVYVVNDAPSIFLLFHLHTTEAHVVKPPAAAHTLQDLPMFKRTCVSGQGAACVFEDVCVHVCATSHCFKEVESGTKGLPAS